MELLLIVPFVASKLAVSFVGSEGGGGGKTKGRVFDVTIIHIPYSLEPNQGINANPFQTEAGHLRTYQHGTCCSLGDTKAWMVKSLSRGRCPIW